MKRFQFPLEKVLRFRGQETEQAKRALAYSLMTEAERRNAWEASRGQVTAQTEAVAQRERRSMTGFDFAISRNYLHLLQQELATASQRLAEAEAETEVKREALVGARRRERVLERLRETRLSAYELESLREEQKELDEFGNRPGIGAEALSVELSRKEA